jgi:hypothetical protein
MLIGVRDLCWFLAGMLCTVAGAVLLKPWLRRVRAARPSLALPRPALIIGVLIVVLAIILFVWLMGAGPPAGAGDASASAHASVDTPPASSAPSAGSMDESLTRLESRLAAQGGTDADWQLLAQTYDFMGRAADAQSARSHQLPASANAADAAAPDSQQTPQPAGGAAPDSAQLDGTVELADALQSQVPAGLTLFVVAKAVDAPGPPVAVLRTTTSHWPVRFSLDDASAMVPDRKLSTVGSVTVQARVSRSGLATPQSGDFQSALATVQPRQRKSVRLVIDHVIR